MHNVARQSTHNSELPRFSGPALRCRGKFRGVFAEERQVVVSRKELMFSDSISMGSF